LIENAAALTGGKRDGASLLKCCVGKLIIFVILIISVGSLETWMSDGNSFVQKLLPLANFPREISQFILQSIESRKFVLANPSKRAAAL